MSKHINHPVHRAVSAFVTDAESVRTCSSLGSMMMVMVRTLVGNKYKEFIGNCQKVENSPTDYLVPPEKILRHNKLQSEFVRGERTSQIVPRSWLIALVGQYDAFLSSLVRALFLLKPGLVNASQKSIEISELMEFKTLDEAKEFVIDGELEALLRESHHQQFEWLEKRFGIETLRNFPAWSKFVELTQRRNLFVHTDGKVSKQYLKVCKANGYDTGNLRPGDQLEADSSYVRQSVDIVFEVAVKLSQVLWRKTLSEEIELADLSLVDITYSLLERKRYGLAVILLDFPFEVLKKHSSPDLRLRLLVNRANAYRLSGNKGKCNALIDGEDWSAYDPAFRLAAHTLKGEISEAATCMKQIGSQGKISKVDYREWPLFEGIREDAKFGEAFEEIFGEKLVVANVATTPEEQAKVAMENLSLDIFSDHDFDGQLARLGTTPKVN